MESLGTIRHYTIGDGDCVAEEWKGAEGIIGWGMRRRKPEEKKFVTGFFFWKDLCTNPPHSAVQVKRKFYNVASSLPGLESSLNDEDLRLKVGDQAYSVHVHVDPLYAGKISISLFPEIFRE